MRMWADLQAAGVLKAELPEISEGQAASSNGKKRKHSDSDVPEKKQGVAPGQNTEQPRKSRRDLDMISGRV